MKKAGVLLLFLLLFLPLSGQAEARSALLMEAKTGRVLYEHNAHEALPMASTTKIMTALLAMERGNLQDRVTTGKNAFGVPGTSIYLSLGESLTLEQMLYGLMLASGNDAAMAIAEHIGGTAERFCAMMTARAEEIGCENTLFSTPHGLPAQDHHTTAYDLCLIAREAMKQPLFRQIVSTQRASIPWENHEYDRVLTNKNKLLSSYPGALGIKTGYTKAAGRCLVFAAERDGMTLIGAVLNCPDWFDEAARILDEGFENWQMVTLLNQGEAVREIAQDGSGEVFRVVTAGDVAAPVPIDRWPDLLIDLPSSLPGGTRPGRQVGAVSLRDQGKTLITVPLVVGESVSSPSFRAGARRVLTLWPLAQ